MSKGLLFCLALAAAGCHRAGEARCPLAGRYELRMNAGAQVVGGRLELTCHHEVPWGRLALALGDSLIGAMAEAGRRGDTIDFRMGGGLSGFALVDRGDSVSGYVVAGRSFPFVGVRTSRQPDPALAAHAVLAPWGPPTNPDSGQSYPVPIAEDTVVFTRHGRRLTRQRLLLATRVDSGWRVTALTAPDDADASDRGPALRPDRRGLVFASTRRLPSDTATPRQSRLWAVERRENGWTAPEPVAAAAAALGDGAQQPAPAADGTLYFTSERPGGQGGRDVYRLAPGAATPEALGAPVSSSGDEHGVWVSPAADLLIVARGGGPAPSAGGDDLYWSVRQGAAWSEPTPFPVPVNSFGNEYGAYLSPDRRTLWFTSDRFGIARLFRVDLPSLGVSLPAAPAGD